MSIFRFYDACCDECGNWYGTTYQPPQTNNKKEALKEMKQNGWQIEKEQTYCEKCKEKTSQKK